MPTALPTMTPMQFLRQLSEVHDMTDDDECPICLQKYVPTNAPPPKFLDRLFSMVGRREPAPIEAEHAVRLPCQHVLGSECIKRWISPAKGRQNTCPYCVQQLFAQMKYPVSDHPLWETLIDYLGAYGYNMDANGFWQWDQTQSAAAMSAKDVMDTIALARTNPHVLAEFVAPGGDTPIFMQRLTAARLTVNLREAVLYLQLQSGGADLPPIEDLPTVTRSPLGYPVIRLKKHQEDALFHEFEQSHLYSPRRIFTISTCNGPHRGAWEADRRLGIVPVANWKDGYYYLGIP